MIFDRAGSVRKEKLGLKKLIPRNIYTPQRNSAWVRFLWSTGTGPNCEAVSVFCWRFLLACACPILKHFHTLLAAVDPVSLQSRWLAWNFKQICHVELNHPVAIMFIETSDRTAANLFSFCLQNLSHSVWSDIGFGVGFHNVPERRRHWRRWAVHSWHWWLHVDHCTWWSLHYLPHLLDPYPRRSRRQRPRDPGIGIVQWHCLYFSHHHFGQPIRPDFCKNTLVCPAVVQFVLSGRRAGTKLDSWSDLVLLDSDLVSYRPFASQANKQPGLQLLRPVDLWGAPQFPIGLLVKQSVTLVNHTISSWRLPLFDMSTLSSQTKVSIMHSLLACFALSSPF